MNARVELPLWMVVVLLLLAAWAALDRLLVPSVRWYLRRRVNRVIDELNTRLDISIRPFQRTRRQVLIDRLLYDPLIVQAAEASARERQMPREVVLADVERYAREIVPAFNAYFYFRLGTLISRRVARLLYRVRLAASDEAALAAVTPDSTVVFLMNHRSNMDYVLVAYLASDRTALSYAVGEWARIWPLQTLIRATGAYFVRRNSRDPLYRRVLERYIQMATTAGVTQAVYPEGGLTRDGRLRPPKLGLLGYMLRTFDPEGERDLVFIPVGINYDRTLEDRTLLLDAAPAAAGPAGSGVAPRPHPGFARALATTLRFVLRQLGLAARNRWHRFGYACVTFGTPISMRRTLRERRLDFRKLSPAEQSERLAALGGELMAAVGAVVPVVPVPLVAAVFVERAERGLGPLSLLELKASAWRRMAELEAAGARVYVPRSDQDYAIAAGLRMLTLRHLVEEREGLYAAREDELPLLRYYANSIAHLAATRPDPAAASAAGPNAAASAESAASAAAVASAESAESAAAGASAEAAAGSAGGGESKPGAAAAVSTA
jgi:glycerol-3-phosphate O-acyltransferase